MMVEAGSDTPKESEEPRALVKRTLAPQPEMAKTLARVRKQTGMGAVQQLRTYFRDARKRLSTKEFYALQVYLPEYDKDDRMAFIGEISTSLLNQQLSPPTLTGLTGFIADKIAVTALLSRLGVPTTQVQAALSQHRQLGQMRVLSGEQDLLRFLRLEARYPLFGKPTDLLNAIGSVSIRSVDANSDTAELMNGRKADLTSLAAEILADYADGYLFEDALEQHPDITDLVGSPVASMRICTVIANEHPEVLYSVWKIPSPTGMADNTWQPGTMIAFPDQQTGVIRKCRRGSGPDTEWIETHPSSGGQLIGFQIPHFEAAKALAISTHAIFPIIGALGWDIAIGPDGPRIIECNDSPAHQLYQLAAARGIRNSDFEPVFQRVVERNKRMQLEYQRKVAALRRLAM